jgi:hypothetical protein
VTLAPYSFILIPYCHTFKKKYCKKFFHISYFNMRYRDVLDVEMFWVTTPFSISVSKSKTRFVLPGSPLCLCFGFHRQSNRINTLVIFSFLSLLYTRTYSFLYIFFITRTYKNLYWIIYLVKKLYIN